MTATFNNLSARFCVQKYEKNMRTEKKSVPLSRKLLTFDKTMKHTTTIALTILGTLLGLHITASAQTDVTDQYLTNAGFDDSSSWQSENITTAATANSKEIAGWTLASSAAWSSSAAFGFGGSGQINSADIPATGSDGTSTGGCLGISTGWGGICQYTQNVTFLPGKYRISYAAYNNLESKTQSYNFIGFVPDNGTATYGVINNFIYQTWMTDEIILELKETTSGKISVGLGAVSEGSGNNAKVLIDYVKIEAWNAVETMMPGSDVTPASWTGNTGTYQSEYPEYYSATHFTGDAMTNTTSVDNGTYSADIFFHAHQAWIGSVAADGTLNAYIKANGVTRPTEIVNNTGFAAYEPKLYHIDDIIVSDGNLNLTVGNSAEGANWLTVKTEKITQMTTPYVSYGAFPLPSEAVTAGYWYRVSIPIAGSYTLSTSGSTTVAYTQDATELTSATFNTTTGGDLTLDAGTLYLKADAAVTLSLTTTSYGYNIGDATVDKTYVQPGQSVTVDFADAISNDPEATLAQDYSGVTLDGTALATTTTGHGFTFTMPEMAAGGEYALVVPAGAIAYKNQKSNTEQTLTIKTTTVYDGTYFLKNQDGYFLARGNDWGTHAIMDPWGLPVKISTDGNNLSTIQFADNDNYLFNTGYHAYTDASSTDDNTQWAFSLANGAYRLASVQQSGKFTKYNDPDGNVFTDGDGANGTIISWNLQSPADHAAEMNELKASLTTLSNSIEGLSTKSYLSCNPTTTAEQYQGVGEVMADSIKITAPGIYKFSIQAFHRMASNGVTYPLHAAQADCPPVYAYFGDTKVQLKSVFDEKTTGDTGFYEDGNNYPNGQDGALIAFMEGRYQNTIWMRIDETGTYKYGIKNQGKAGENAHWTCYAKDGIEITRYYDLETEGLDQEDQEKADLIASLRHTVGDVDENEVITVADVKALVNILLGKTTVYKDYLADVNEDKAVTIADVTALINILLGKTEAKTVDLTFKYADLDAMVYTEQTASENNDGADYMMNSAVSTLTGDDVSASYNMQDYLTTLNISSSLSNVASVSVYALGHENIAGPMTVNCSDEEISYSYSTGNELTYANSQESDVITVSNASSGTTPVFLRPVDLSQGVMVTIRTTDGKFYSQDFANITAGQTNELTFTQTSAQNLWMATLPGNTYFSMLSTPGAHDACTSSVTSYTDIAKCQSEDLAGLLANGVRAFDLRPRYTSNTQSDIELDNLTIYHGYVSTGVKFKDAIDILINFVKNNPSEAVSVIMNKESTKLITEPTDQSETWRASIRECFSDEARSPYLMGSVRGYHTLNDVRGKVSIVSRNPYGNSSNSYRDVVYGAIIENWPDDGVVTDYSCAMTQAWNWVDCRASVEDAYNSTTSTKQTQVQTQLQLASSNTDHFHYNYTYTSIANSPASYANTMNPATVTIIDTLTGPLCYVYGDYMGSSSNGGANLLRAIINQNYKYVFTGRSHTE